MTIAILLLVVLSLAYANGANDNFKGVATLFGSGTTNYRGALLWATVTTFLGSLTAVFLAGQLLKNFSGRGLVDSNLVTSSQYVQAVALGAGLTVLLATKVGMPISTTHGPVGALVGAGWAAGSAVNVEKLGLDFFAPLLTSPLLAIVATALCYPLLRVARQRPGKRPQGGRRDEPQDHVDESRPGVRSQPRYRGDRHRRQPPGNARLDDPRVMRSALWDRHGDAPGASTYDSYHPHRVGHNASHCGCLGSDQLLDNGRALNPSVKPTTSDHFYGPILPYLWAPIVCFVRRFTLPCRYSHPRSCFGVLSVRIRAGACHLNRKGR
jgi:hypothetical protein